MELIFYGLVSETSIYNPTDPQNGNNGRSK